MTDARPIARAIVLCAVWAVVLLARPAWAEVPVLELKADQQRVSVDRFAEVLVDPDGRLTLAEVRSPDLADRFVRGLSDVEAPPGRQTVYWVHLRLKREAHAGEHWFLAMPHRRVNEVTLFQAVGDEVIEARSTGFATPPDPALPTNRYPVFAVTPGADAPTELYLRATGLAFASLDMTVTTPEALHRFERRSKLLFGFIFGALVAAAAYLVMIWRVSHSGSLPVLLGMIFAFAGHTAASSGFARDFVPWLHGTQYVLLVDWFIVATWILGVEFARRFLHTRLYMPRWDMVLRGLIAASIAYGVWELTAVHWGGPGVIYGSFITLLTLTALNIVALIKRVPGALAYLLGWGWLSIGGAGRLASDSGLVTDSLLASNAYYVSLGICSLTLAIGVVERIRHEKQEREARHQAIVNSALDTILSVDREGRVLEFNPAGEAMYGYRRAELLGRPALDFLAPANLREDFKRYLQEFIRQGSSPLIRRRIETVGLRADGSTFPVEVYFVPGLDEASFLNCYLRDLTEEKRLKEELKRQREALFQTEKLGALGSLLAGVAHELNNPLSVVVGRASMLKERADDERTRSAAEKIHGAAKRCARIVKSFLAMARNRPKEHVRVDLNEVVASAVELMADTLRSDDVELIVETAPVLPVTFADPDQLTQVLINLMANAHYALCGTSGQRKLRITTQYEEAGDQLEVVMEDSGPGIAQEVRDRIFEPFFTTKAVGEGTGLGLSVSRSIVEAHNGRMKVDTGAMGGARFTVCIPRLEAPPEAVVAPRSFASQQHQDPNAALRRQGDGRNVV